MIKLFRRDITVITCCLILSAVSQSVAAGSRSQFHQRHQAGIRLGVWANSGELPPKQDSLGTFETNFSDASAYFEFFAGYRIASYLMAELSIGFTNRGQVSFIEAGGSNIGNVLVHPILVHL
ncbi:MAG: hypothetical protein AB1744_04650, partial [Candidatus Zixiibacteriota bacterium]